MLITSLYYVYLTSLSETLGLCVITWFSYKVLNIVQSIRWSKVKAHYYSSVFNFLIWPIKSSTQRKFLGEGLGDDNSLSLFPHRFIILSWPLWTDTRNSVFRKIANADWRERPLLRSGCVCRSVSCYLQVPNSEVMEERSSNTDSCPITT